ncbi:MULTISPECIES: hypothetical protein [unclassified Streptomyces]|uniref:hypothetical protein n=1 Tax=unclassified Streptomyces TaxID=2593676 RepID=UPI0024A8A117|nr:MULTISPECIES: hypothetical protein [unclassified Streptomyces]
MQRSTHINLNGPTGTVLVNGQDISHCVRGLTLTADVGRDVPALELDLVVYEATVEGKAHVSIPPSTADVLTALGWTPPDGYDATSSELRPLPPS